jgi:uncharacterized integral membrane protein
MIKNNKAYIINAIGWIDIIVGIIGSFILGKVFPLITVDTFLSDDKKYNWPLVITGIVISILSGVVFIGFAEIINLLQARVDQSEKLEELFIEYNKTKNLSLGKSGDKNNKRISEPFERKFPETKSDKEVSNSGNVNNYKPIPGTKVCAKCGAICNVKFLECDICGSNQFT